MEITSLFYGWRYYQFLGTEHCFLSKNFLLRKLVAQFHFKGTICRFGGHKLAFEKYFYSQSYPFRAFTCGSLRGAFNKFPDFFGMDTFINRTHKKL